MTAIITELTCPSCGGRIMLDDSNPLSRCDYCGNEYIIKQDDGSPLIEPFARCPVCRQNDKVQKVTSIIASQTIEGNSVSTHTQIDVNHKRNEKGKNNQPVVTSTQVTCLAQRLSPPPQPPKLPTIPKPILYPTNIRTSEFRLSGCGISLLVCAVIWLILTLPPVIRENLGEAFGWVQPFLIIVLPPIFFCLIFGCLILWYSSSKFYKKKRLDIIERRKAENQTAIERNEQAIREYRQKVEDAEQPMHLWKHQMENWSKLYYCSRDDCVFVPGRKNAVSISDMLTYISSEQ